MNSMRVIITGGATGTGQALAKKLTKQGCHTMIWGRNKDRLEQVVSEKSASIYRVVDIADISQVSSAYQDYKNTFGIPSAVVHCAGIWIPGKLVDIDPQAISNHIQTIGIGSIAVIRGAIQIMQEQGGKIIQVAAASAKPGFVDTALNTIAKRTQDGIQESLSRELRGSKIFITTIYPDSIASQTKASVKEGRAMSYDDVANTIVFVLESGHTVHIQEIVLTAPNTGR